MLKAGKQIKLEEKQLARKLEELKLVAQQNRIEGQLTKWSVMFRGVSEAKLEWKNEMLTHKKYQGLVKCYTKDEYIRNWLRNLEIMLEDEQIPV